MKLGSKPGSIARGSRGVFGPLFLVIAMVAAAVAGCYSRVDDDLAARGGTDGPSDASSSALTCTPTRSSSPIPQLASAAGVTVTVDVADLVTLVGATCGPCHSGPNDTPFQLQPGADGLRTSAMSSRMILQTLTGAMPPNAGAATQKTAVALGQKLKAWADQGFQDGTFTVSGEAAADPAAKLTLLSPDIASTMTDLGNCIPSRAPDAPSPEVARDAYFAGLTKLPTLLSDLDTDVYTLDAAKMAAAGTYAYAPQYPLWSDDAKKLRLVHVPQGQSIVYDPATKHFKVPANTRFYKTFFKAVWDKDGKLGYRKIETRLIVTRERWQDALFGTYLWNADETVAELHDVRLRNGQPFTDRVLTYDVDLHWGGTRNYAVPSSTRCIQCHEGSEGNDFVLGFSPLQINRRPETEGGSYERGPAGEDELSQVDRLIRYGVITGIASAKDLPKLEDSGRAKGRPPRNDYELKAQGYFTGNCAHCHNPQGFAVESNPALAAFDLSPGGVVFGFPNATSLRGGLNDTVGQAYLQSASWDPAAGGSAGGSILRHVSEDTSQELIHMPTNTAGKDCRLVRIVEQWGASIDPDDTPSTATPEQIAAARDARLAIQTACVAPSDVYWVGEDTTDKVPYQPRNNSWADPVQGIASSFVAGLDVTPELIALKDKQYYTSFWHPKAECSFTPVPEASFPALPTIPQPSTWMLDDLGAPKQNWSQLYVGTPPANVFQSICADCHGPKGNGQSGPAKVLTALTGYRVADLASGLFGPPQTPHENLKTFEALGPNGGAKYLVWMASGGTKVKFPKGFIGTWVGRNTDADAALPTADTIDTYGGNMLGAARGVCDSIRKDAWPTLGTSVGGKQLWTDICTTNNPLDASLRAGTSPAAVASWLNRAQFNAGVMAYFYLYERLSVGKPPYPLKTQCELRGNL